MGVASLAATSALADEPIQARLLELHSCELFAGGCKVSSEAPQGGRYMLRVWNFDKGSVSGVNLSGLSVAVLEVSDDNLAAQDTRPHAAVIYLPAGASATERAALVNWLKSSQTELTSTRYATRVLPMQYRQQSLATAFTAGDVLSVRTAPREDCGLASCGETCWYRPRTQTRAFVVALNLSSRVNEPLLDFKWNDSGRPTVFLGWINEAPPADATCSIQATSPVQKLSYLKN